MDNKDITKYKSLEEIFDATTKFRGEEGTKGNFKPDSNHHVVFEDDKLIVLIPLKWKWLASLIQKSILQSKFLSQLFSKLLTLETQLLAISFLQCIELKDISTVKLGYNEHSGTIKKCSL